MVYSGDESATLTVYGRPEHWYVRAWSRDTNRLWWKNDYLAVVSPADLDGLADALEGGRSSTVLNLRPPKSLREPPPDERIGEMLRLAGVKSESAFIRIAICASVSYFENRVLVEGMLPKGRGFDFPGVDVEIPADSTATAVAAAVVEVLDRLAQDTPP